MSELDRHLRVRLSPHEWAVLQGRAKARGLSVSEYVRWALSCVRPLGVSDAEPAEEPSIAVEVGFAGPAGRAEVVEDTGGGSSGS